MDDGQNSFDQSRQWKLDMKVDVREGGGKRSQTRPYIKYRLSHVQRTLFAAANRIIREIHQKIKLSDNPVSNINQQSSSQPVPASNPNHHHSNRPIPGPQTITMRLTAELINTSISFLNPLKERELDLRGEPKNQIQC